jgi:Xaa-Pro aminopeptidase
LALEEAFPAAEFLDATSLFRLIRLVKTPEELDRMRRATQLNERAIEAFQKEIAADRTEKEAASVYYRTVGEGGGRWYWFHLASGRRASAIFPPSDKRFEPGDSWKFDAGSRLEGYCADGGGCGVVGAPSPEIERDWRAISKGLERGFEVMRAGVKGSEIFEAALGGLKEEGVDYNGVFVGHTMGAEAREFPWTLGKAVPVDDPFLPESTDISIPAGAVLSYEIPTGVFGMGGCHAEYTVVLTEGGFEHLMEHPPRTLYCA